MTEILNFYFELRKRLRQNWKNPSAELWMNIDAEAWECEFLWSETVQKMKVKISVIEIDWKATADLVARRFIAGEGADHAIHEHRESPRPT